MPEATAVGSRSTTHTRGSVIFGLLVGTMLVALWFVRTYAFPFLTLNRERFGDYYWARRGWLLLHIAGGMTALLLGPVQLWLGLSRGRFKLHRGLGLAYIASVALGSCGALYLAYSSDVGVIYVMGLTGWATAWVLTTGLAFISIHRKVIVQHQEWMIRSYVVTFGFVTYRVFLDMLQVADVGTVVEQASAGTWFCWAVPLLITEMFLQGRKIFAA